MTQYEYAKHQAKKKLTERWTEEVIRYAGHVAIFLSLITPALAQITNPPAWNNGIYALNLECKVAEEWPPDKQGSVSQVNIHIEVTSTGTPLSVQTQHILLSNKTYQEGDEFIPGGARQVAGQVEWHWGSAVGQRDSENNWDTNGRPLTAGLFSRLWENSQGWYYTELLLDANTASPLYDVGKTPGETIYYQLSSNCSVVK